MSKFNTGDTVSYDGFRGLSTGTVIGHKDNLYGNEIITNVEWFSGPFKGQTLTATDGSLRLVKAADNTKGITAAELRAAASNHAEFTTAYTALMELADKLDPPKPFVAEVQVEHSAFNNWRVNVNFKDEAEREKGAKAISHFLHKASGIVDEIYINDPVKQSFVREFVDAWHDRIK